MSRGVGVQGGERESGRAGERESGKAGERERVNRGTEGQTQDVRKE